MVLAGTALSEPATRRSVRRREVFAGAVIVFAIALIVVAIGLARQDRTANAVQQDGVAAEATVVSIDSVPTGRGAFAAGSAVVTFDVAGAVEQATIDMGTNISQVHVGSTLTIVYDPADPSHAQVQGTRASTKGLPFVPVAFVAAIFVGMAVVVVRHVLGLRRVLQSGPWVPLPAVIRQVPLGGGKRGGTRVVVRLEGPDGAFLVETIGFNRIDPGLEPEAWLVGLAGTKLVAALPSGRHPIYLRRVRKA